MSSYPPNRYLGEGLDFLWGDEQEPTPFMTEQLRLRLAQEKEDRERLKREREAQNPVSTFLLDTITGKKPNVFQTEEEKLAESPDRPWLENFKSGIYGAIENQFDPMMEMFSAPKTGLDKLVRAGIDRVPEEYKDLTENLVSHQGNEAGQLAANIASMKPLSYLTQDQEQKAKVRNEYPALANTERFLERTSEGLGGMAVDPMTLMLPEAPGAIFAPGMLGSVMTGVEQGTPEGYADALIGLGGLGLIAGGAKGDLLRSRNRRIPELDPIQATPDTTPGFPELDPNASIDYPIDQVPFSEEISNLVDINDPVHNPYSQEGAVGNLAAARKQGKGKFKELGPIPEIDINDPLQNLSDVEPIESTGDFKRRMEEKNRGSIDAKALEELNRHPATERTLKELAEIHGTSNPQRLAGGYFHDVFTTDAPDTVIRASKQPFGPGERAVEWPDSKYVIKPKETRFAGGKQIDVLPALKKITRPTPEQVAALEAELATEGKYTLADAEGSGGNLTTIFGKARVVDPGALVPIEVAKNYEKAKGDPSPAGFRARQEMQNYIRRRGNEPRNPFAGDMAESRSLGGKRRGWGSETGAVEFGGEKKSDLQYKNKPIRSNEDNLPIWKSDSAINIGKLSPTGEQLAKQRGVHPEQNPNKLWPITEIPSSEYAKADADPNYVPREEIVGYIESPYESLVAKKLKQLSKSGDISSTANFTEPGTKPFIDIESEVVKPKQLLPKFGSETGAIRIGGKKGQGYESNFDEVEQDLINRDLVKPGEIGDLDPVTGVESALSAKDKRTLGLKESDPIKVDELFDPETGEVLGDLADPVEKAKLPEFNKTQEELVAESLGKIRADKNKGIVDQDFVTTDEVKSKSISTIPPVKQLGKGNGGKGNKPPQEPPSGNGGGGEGPKDTDIPTKDPKDRKKSLFDVVTDIPKELKSSLDVSFAGRQGLFFLNRAGGRKGVKEGLHSLVSKNKHEDVKDYLANKWENRDVAKKAGLNQIEYDPTSIDTKSEEFGYQSLGKVPVVKQAERSFIDSGNLVRANMFDEFVQKHGQGKTFEDNPEFYKGVADYVNTLTGRKPLPEKLRHLSNIANKFLWSPQFVNSRIALMNPVFYAKLPKEMRLEALRDVGGTLGAMVTLTGAIRAAAKGAGEDVEVGTNPLKSNFGWIKAGKISYNLFAGTTQLVKLYSRLASGRIEEKDGTKKLAGFSPGSALGLNEDLPKASFEGSTGNEIGRFARSKEGPTIGSAHNLLTGKDYLGQEFNVSDLPEALLAPMAIEEFISAYKRYGWEEALKTLPNFAGVQTQVEKPLAKNKKKKKSGTAYPSLF